jgi:hypothetical protein
LFLTLPRFPEVRFDGKPKPGPKASAAIKASKTHGGNGQPGGRFCEV